VEKMKTKSMGTLLIAGLVVLAAMVVFVTPAMADEEEDPFKIYGIILDANGNPDVGREVIIEKQHDIWGNEVWRPLKAPPGWGYMPITNDTGYYSTGWCFLLQGYGWPWDNYRMYIDGNLVAERYIGCGDWDKERCIFWSHRWDYQIPEFATIAVPAASILGLFFFYNHRKRRKN